jgi:hypothetical protein
MQTLGISGWLENCSSTVVLQLCWAGLAISLGGQLTTRLCEKLSLLSHRASLVIFSISALTGCIIMVTSATCVLWLSFMTPF